MPRRHPIQFACEDRMILHLIAIWLLFNALVFVWMIPPYPAEAFAH